MTTLSNTLNPIQLLFICILFLLGHQSLSYAQDSKKLYISIGTGFNSQPFNSNVKDLSSTKHFNLAKELVSGISIGPYLNYKKVQINNLEKLEGQSILGVDCTVGLRSNIHYVKLKRFHLYTGGALGLRVLALDKNDSGTPSNSLSDRYEIVRKRIETGLYTGTSIFFTQWLGGFAEIGSGKDLLRAGINLKF